MATLLELKGLITDSDLQDKVETSLIIAVQAVLDGTPTADQQKYAAHVFASTRGEASKALMSVLATNNGLTTAQILGATDTAIKSNVAAVVDTLTVAFIAGV